jgi:2-aminoadipate transaminase
VVQKLVQAKQGADLHTSTFGQMLAYDVAHGGFLDQHIKVIRAVYGARRDAMLAALDRYFPPEVTWTRPQGGLFLWVTFPEDIDAADLLKVAVQDQKVAFVPGTSFFADGSVHNTARFNFSYCNEKTIEEGIGRLSIALKKFMTTRATAVARCP